MDFDVLAKHIMKIKEKKDKYLHLATELNKFKKCYMTVSVIQMAFCTLGMVQKYVKGEWGNKRSENKLKQSRSQF